MHLIDYAGDSIIEFARKDAEKELQEFLNSEEHKKLQQKSKKELYGKNFFVSNEIKTT